MRRFLDRSDGKLLRRSSHYTRIIPYVMPRRVDASVYYNQRVEIAKAEEVLREVNEKHNMAAGIMDLIIATFVRTISQKPKVNRFVHSKKIYARNNISVAFAVKKNMDDDSETTEVKVFFEPTDTIVDVSRKIREAIENNKGMDTSNNQDAFTKFMRILPGFVISFVIGLIKLMDRFRIMPKFIYDLSPFHASFFVTNLGSLRIDSVYHHLYEIGTVSWFCGLGKKKSEYVVQKDGSVKKVKYMEIRYVLDERIADGFYGANALRLMTKYMNNPRLLLDPPEKVVVDDEI